MAILIFLLKLMLKILVVPLWLLLRFVWFITRLLSQLSGWILSPVMLFVLGFDIYYLVQMNWTNVFLLTLIAFGLFVIGFGAIGLMEVIGGVCDWLAGVLAW